MRRMKRDERARVALTLNGRKLAAEAEPRTLLSDFLRQNLGATGTHVGCEHGICGACTVLIDGAAVRSCLTLAVQAEGCEVRTVESLAAPDGTLNPLQQAFRNNHALQCGFCTPGILMSFTDYPRPQPDAVRKRNPRGLERPSVPLHRLCRHRQSDRGSGLIRPREVKRGRGTTRSMVEGARAVRQVSSGNASSSADAPSTTLHRSAVPLPRFRGAG